MPSIPGVRRGLGSQDTHGTDSYQHIDSTCAHRHILDIVLIHSSAQVNLVCVVVDLEGNQGEACQATTWTSRGVPAPTVVQAELHAHPQHLLPTAFTPESCWPAMRTMMEMTCHRRDLILNSFSTEMKPAAFSALSSSRISSISASTSCQPRSLLRAGGASRGRVAGWTTVHPPTPEKMPESQSLLFVSRESLTAFGSCFIFLLNQQVPGTLREEGQEEELQHSGDPSQSEEDGPACKETSVTRELIPVPQTQPWFQLASASSQVEPYWPLWPFILIGYLWVWNTGGSGGGGQDLCLFIPVSANPWYLMTSGHSKHLENG